MCTQEGILEGIFGVLPILRYPENGLEEPRRVQSLQFIECNGRPLSRANNYFHLWRNENLPDALVAS
jgi:hypothetical protein